MHDSRLRVGVVGGLGLMASPMAKHWRSDGPARALCVHDRGTRSSRHDRCRLAWTAHGAELVPEVSDVVRPDIDGVFVCCGKNGDDASIIGGLARSLASNGDGRFICHLSTVSSQFVEAATIYAGRRGVTYVNYPLTGGPMGAERATMLILAGGSKDLYQRLEPALLPLGKPRYFGSNPSAGAEVKFMGHLMVFNGLMGVCSAAALHAECFREGRLGGSEQSDFFDFLNAGAGGTQQWTLILSSGIRNDVWSEPFSIRYGVVDALYTAELCMARGLSDLTVEAVLNVALAFSFVMNEVGPELATHAIVRELVASRAPELDAFIRKHRPRERSVKEALQLCLRSLPQDVQRSAGLDANEASFDQ